MSIADMKQKLEIGLAKSAETCFKDTKVPNPNRLHSKGTQVGNETIIK